MNLQKFTEKAQQAILSTPDLAREFGHAAVEPEHLLVALVEQADGVVPSVLRKLSIDPTTLAREVREALGGLPRVSGGAEPHLSPRLRVVADAATADGIAENSRIGYAATAKHAVTVGAIAPHAETAVAIAAHPMTEIATALHAVLIPAFAPHADTVAPITSKHCGPLAGGGFAQHSNIAAAAAEHADAAAPIMAPHGGKLAGGVADHANRASASAQHAVTVGAVALHAGSIRAIAEHLCHLWCLLFS